VVLGLKSLGQGPDRRRLAPVQPLDLQQQQVLLRRHARRPRGDFPGPQEPPHLIPEVRERPVVDVWRLALGASSAHDCDNITA
jgi:hypothetical protein